MKGQIADIGAVQIRDDVGHCRLINGGQFRQLAGGHTLLDHGFDKGLLDIFPLNIRHGIAVPIAADLQGQITAELLLTGIDGGTIHIHIHGNVKGNAAHGIYNVLEDLIVDNGIAIGTEAQQCLHLIHQSLSPGVTTACKTVDTVDLRNRLSAVHNGITGNTGQSAGAVLLIQ